MAGLAHASLPALLELRAHAHGFSLLPRQPPGSLLAGRHASRLRGRGLAFEELRPYRPGDDIRTIDWRATARLRTTQVRVYSEERERPVLLLVDQRRGMFFGSRRAMKSVAAAEAAALGAGRALAAGDRVGGIVFGDDELVELAPQRSRQRVLRLCDALVRMGRRLAAVPAGAATVTLDQALEAALRRAVHDHLVVLISDFAGASAMTEGLIVRLAAHNDLLAVGVYDPLGAGLRGGSGMLAQGGGRLVAVPPGATFAETFQQGFAAEAARWTTLFRALRVPVLPLSAAEPVLDQVQALFGRAGARR
jgi:uncharacterized protein (DUF58 family)